MRKITMLATATVLSALMLTGCGSGLKNEYVTVGQYKGVEAEYETTDVTEEDIEAAIRSAMVNAGLTETVEVKDRAVEDGDTAIINYEGKLDGVAFQGGTDDSEEGTNLVIGSGMFIPGFEEQIIGHKAGETFDINVTFPETYGNTELAGKDTVFTIKLKGITTVQYPELSDEVAGKLSETAKTVDELKEETKAALEEENRQSLLNTVVPKIWQTILDGAEVKGYPEEELQALIETYKTQLQQTAAENDMEYDEYIGQYGYTADTIVSYLSGTAKEELKTTMVAKLIAEKESLAPEEEITRRIEEYCENNKTMYAAYGREWPYEDTAAFVKELEDNGTYESFKNSVIIAIVEEWCFDNCSQVSPK